jgi:transposase-like protein
VVRGSHSAQFRRCAEPHQPGDIRGRRVRSRTLAAAAALTDDADLPTARTTLASRYVRVMLTCWHCRHQADADLQGIIDAGRGDVPLIRLRWRCAQCRSDRIDMICTSHARVVPWRVCGRLRRPQTCSCGAGR